MEKEGRKNQIQEDTERAEHHTAPVLNLKEKLYPKLAFALFFARFTKDEVLLIAMHGRTAVERKKR